MLNRKIFIIKVIIGMKNNINRILRESIRNVLFENIEGEERKQLDNGNIIEIDNFDEVSKLINITSSDDVYFVKIVQRRKDDPSHTLKADNYVKYYLINSVDELMQHKNEIRYFCIKNNARAYITANKRSKTETDKFAQQYIAYNKRNPYNGKYHFIKGHETEYAYGRTFEDRLDRDVVMIDIDSPDKSIHDEVHQILKKHGIEIIMEYPSLNDGLHIFIKGQEKILNVYFANEFLKFDGGKDLGRLSTVGIDFDKNALLYCCTEPQGYRTNYSNKTTQMSIDNADKTRMKRREMLNNLKNKKASGN